MHSFYYSIFGAHIAHLSKIRKKCPIMLALCLMLLVTYFARNYAGIIGASLANI